MQTQIESINNFVVDTNIETIKNIIADFETSNYPAVILDIQHPNFTVSDLPILIELFAQKQMVVIGIRADDEGILEFAKFSNLAIFNKYSTQESTEEHKLKQIIDKKPTIIYGNVAKNEQIFAKNCDLIITGDLLDNAEAMSDENIRIYGGGYGKVFAGIKNKNASIFVNYFQLKLVCINGIYKKFSKIPKEYLNKTILITLIDKKLNFKIL